jgi:DNA-binding FadR family transcriptional regulator
MSRLHRSLLRVFIAEIVNGTLAAGERLPTETELAQRFDVSRGVARECLRGLEERGLVAVKHGSGATVLPSAEWDMLNPDVVTALLESDDSSRVLGDYLECRRLLEIEAAGLAAERASGPHLVALSNALDRMTAAAVEASGSPSAEERFHEADVAFHRAVIRATGNLALGRMTEPVHRALAAARRPLARPEHRLGRSLPEHREILSAIAARDPDAARAAMRNHLLTVERYLREYEDSERPGRSAHAEDTR